MFNGGTTFNSGLQMPHIVSDSDASSYANNGLTYPDSVSREYPDGASVSTGLPWFPACPAVFPCNASVDKSDPETISSHSPESYTSDTQCSEIQAFSAAPIPNTGPPISDWGYYSSPPNTAIKASSPKLTPDMTGGIAGINFSGLPRAGLDISDPSPTSVAGIQSSNGLGVIYEDNSQYGSDLQPSQNSSPEVSPWFSHGQPHDLVAMPLRPKEPPVSSAPIQSMSGTYQAQLSRNMPRELAAWGELRASVPQQEPSESRFHTRRTMETHDQRKADDEILLDGKRDGLTYKEISKKMHVKCAESTLRGRYRSLTKARKDRVRKPVWHKKDVSQSREFPKIPMLTCEQIELLEVFVMQDLDRIDSNNHQSLSYDQRLAKVQWKKVADSIHANGGTYHFGNSTCKRKWQELSPNS
jgi:hypothetical protein